MRKLKSKIFWTLLIILSLFLLTIIFIYNYQDYSLAKNDVKQNLFRMNDERKDNYIPKDDMFKEENPKKFIDATIYTVILNERKDIIYIISHKEDGTIDDNINDVVKDITEKDRGIYIGNLYFERYSYNYENNYIILIDNIEVNKRLDLNLEKSFILFILAEVIIILLAKMLANWLIKPVEESFNKQKQFIADASHELKTPLSVIMASADCLEEDPKEHKWLNIIKNETDRMNKLITNLLDLAKVENTEIVKENVNLSKLVEITLLSFESITYEKNIKLKYDIERDIEILGNTEELRELVSILLDNAIKHSDSLIKVNLKKEKNNIILEVINKGEAILKGEEEKIFERFYRSDKSRNRKDNRYGLGLAIAKGIVEKHDGKISANSADGYTTFTVALKSYNSKKV